jgi:orotidine 5'-phosphate decarboxylase subfamily 2
MNFADKFHSVAKKNDSLLCIGLDADITKLPSFLFKKSDPLFQFNQSIIDATYDLVCAYKPNIAFYEAEGIEGLKSLKRTIEYLKKYFPQIPLILDAKRGDIGNTAEKYAKAVFEYWQADAVTVYHYLGLDSLTPFLNYQDKLTIILIKTSNPDSETFQDIPIDGKPYYLKIAEKIKTWKYENFGVFIGATYPAALKQLRNLFPERIILSAGIGTQAADIEQAVRAGVSKNGSDTIFNVSRNILYASRGDDYALQARKEAIRLRDLINKYRI